MPRVPTFVIVNPKSASGRTGREWSEIEEPLQRAMGPFDAKLTERPMHAADLAREALQAGYETICVAGGDGTNYEVINGWFDESGKAWNPDAAFATLPLGTGGDFRKSLGIPRDPLDAAEVIRSTKARPIDAGRLTYTGHDGSGKRGHFINIADAGVSGQVVKTVETTTKPLGGFLSFLLGTMITNFTYRNQHVRLRLDDGEWRDAKVYNLVVANGRYFGGGMEIAPEARLDDGLFDVVVMGDISQRELLREFSVMYRGRRYRNPKIQYLRAEKVEATSEDTVLLDVDGEGPGRLPATFEIMPGALKARGLF